jgi:RNA polymerase primary sigma factor
MAAVKKSADAKIKKTKAGPVVAPASDEARENASVSKGSIQTILKKLIAKGKDQGFVTYDELNAALPAQEFSSEQIEDAMATLSDIGIQMVDGDGDGADEDEKPEKEKSSDEEYESGGNINSDDLGRTDDPVRMYLREMGTVELLSREGEIAIAKRIEAGREMMIGGLCESPLAIESIIAWNEGLKKGNLFLREIIDLDATYGSDGSGDDFEEDDDKPEGEAGAEGDEPIVTLSAMEQELLPQVFEKFDKIQKTYKKLRKYQDERIEIITKAKEPEAALNKKYDGVKAEMVLLMNEVRLHNARIDQLIQRLYTTNRELVALEGKVMRVAVESGVKREEFLENWYGHELDPRWITKVKKLTGKGWIKFIDKHEDDVKALREQISGLGR